MLVVSFFLHVPNVKQAQVSSSTRYSQARMIRSWVLELDLRPSQSSDAAKADLEGHPDPMTKEVAASHRQPCFFVLPAKQTASLRRSRHAVECRQSLPSCLRFKTSAIQSVGPLRSLLGDMRSAPCACLVYRHEATMNAKKTVERYR